MADMQPMSGYACVRPYRAAFLIDPDNCPSEHIDAIIDTSQRLWGGRCYPIIPVQGGTISDAYWRLLVFADPDLIYTYVALPLDLLARIDRTICPLQVRCHPAHALTETPPSYRPYNLVHNVAGYEPFIPAVLGQEGVLRPARILTIQTHREDWAPRRFVLRNFGLLEETALLWQQIGAAQTFPIAPDRTEALILRDIAGAKARVVLPHELAAYWSDLDEPDQASQDYALVLGDDIWAALFAWNRIARVATSMREQWHTMWLPTHLMRDSAFCSALNGFLHRYVLRYENTPPRMEVVYSTSSVGSENDARTMTRATLDHVDCLVTFKALSPGEYPSVEQCENRFEAFERRGWHRPPVFQFQAPARSFLVHVPAGTIADARGTKMLDLKIEYRPEHPTYTNFRYWWRLPKVLNITRGFGRIGRVVTGGCVSFPFENQASLELTVPEPAGVLHHPLVGYRHPAYTDDVRPKTPPPFYSLRPSDKGQYNRGIGALFGDVATAGRFFQHRYWRSVTELLCGRRLELDARVMESITGRLQKDQAVIVGASTGDAAAIERLAEYILEVARRQQLRYREVHFEMLLTRLNQERAAFVQAHPDGGFAVNKGESLSELRTALQELTGAEILLQGVRVKCGHCGSTFWYGAEAIAAQMRCEGCRAAVALPVEVKWSYRLNSLVLNGVASHGSVPVLSTLADLSRETQSFFIVGLGVELFEGGKSDPAVELDLAGILDGRFFIGEVKTDPSKFDDRKLQQLADTACSVGAHLLILAAFAGDQTVLGQQAQVLRTKLSDRIGRADVEVRTVMPNDRAFAPEFYLSY